ncbi:uncharacterized protein LOC130990509 [Salvia miltiorrhiza]|uniref:uncharacterized protein LOC130990509 n=1 Tax=Salvia miltiorrhiza TaxID=226208 RepID=UPI0025AD7762|nr:uncharacterized protein LOC130990509 [Salvia miltiorrhiza]
MVENLFSVIAASVPCLGKKDGWRWKPAKDGAFSTKSAYETIKMAKGEPDAGYNKALAKVWEAPNPHKARVTAWRSLRNRLATCDNLLKMNVPIEIEERWCNACVAYEETVEHIFLHCPES